MSADNTEIDADGFVRPQLYIKTHSPLAEEMRNEIKRIKSSVTRRLKTVEQMRRKLLENSIQTAAKLEMLIKQADSNTNLTSTWQEDMFWASQTSHKLNNRWKNFLVMQKKAEEKKRHLEYLEYQYRNFNETKYIKAVHRNS